MFKWNLLWLFGFIVVFAVFCCFAKLYQMWATCGNVAQTGVIGSFLADVAVLWPRSSKQQEPSFNSSSSGME